MKESSMEILKEVLSEQMEVEANAVPHEEELRRKHIFSTSFIKNMRELVKTQGQMERAAGKEREKAGECVRKPEDVCVSKQSGGQEENAECVPNQVMKRTAAEAQNEERQEKENTGYVPDGEMNRKEETASDEETQAGKAHRMLSGFSEKLANRTVKRIMTACIVCVIFLGVSVIGYQGLLRAGRSSSSDSGSVMVTMDGEEDGMMEEDTAETIEESAEIGMEGSGKGEETENDDEKADSSDDSEKDSESTGASESGEFYEGAYMTAENVTDHSLTLHMVNSTGEGFTYGDFYEIECYEEETDTWVLLEAAQDVGFDDVAYLVSDGEECILDVDWTDVYGNLTAGTYRFVKEVQSEADETFYTLTAEFVVE